MSSLSNNNLTDLIPSDLVYFGIPDGIAVFVEMVDEAFKGNFPKDVFGHILSFVPQFKKKSYTIVLNGCGGVGKQEFIENLSGKEYESSHHSSGGAVFTEMNFNTNYGPVKLVVWDVQSTRMTWWIETRCFCVDGAIVMYDATSRITKKDNPNYIRNVRRDFGNVPICVVANKCDKRYYYWKGERKRYARYCAKQGCHHVELLKGERNQIEPVVYLLRKFLGVPPHAPYPPTPVLAHEKIQEKMYRAANLPLRKGDDDEL